MTRVTVVENVMHVCRPTHQTRADYVCIIMIIQVKHQALQKRLSPERERVCLIKPPDCWHS